MTSFESFARRGTVFVLIAVFFWGGSASLAKLLFTTRLDTLIVVQSRSSLSFLLLVIYFLFHNRSVFRIERKDLGALILAGVIGIAVATVGIVTTMELVVAITITYFALGESLGQIQVLGGVAVVAAVVLLQWAESRKWIQARRLHNAG